MLNLIRMDFYRLFRTKSVRRGAIVAAIFAFLTSLLNLGILEITKLALEDDPEAAEGIGVFFSVVGWLNGVDFAEIILVGTGMLSLFVSCMIAASFVGGEQSCGYAKNIAGQIPNRGLMIVSKFVATCSIQLMVLVIYTAVCSICAGMFFGDYITGYSIGTMIAGLGLRFLLFCAVDAVLLFFCTLTKSHAVAMVVGAIFGIGVTSLVYKAADMLLSMVNITIDVAKLMPDGINGLISAADLSSIVARAFIVAIVFITVFLTGAALLFKKRDVR